MSGKNTSPHNGAQSRHPCSRVIFCRRLCAVGDWCFAASCFAIIRSKADANPAYRSTRASKFHASAVAPRDDVDANRCNNHAGARGAALRAADTVVPADRVFSAAEAKGGSAIDASKTALLLVEYQNEFTTEGGKLHDAVKESMAATGMLERSAKLADEARNKGVTIIHAPITFKEDASDNPNK